MSIYVQREYGLLTGYLQRMTLRLDGFASVNAPYQGGEMITRPLKFFGEKLEINYSTSECGSIRIEIQNPDGSVDEKRVTEYASQTLSALSFALGFTASF